MNRKLNKTIISLILAFVMMSINVLSVSIQNVSGSEKEITICENGQEYSILVKYSSDSYNIVVKNDSCKNYTELEVNLDEEYVKSTEYMYVKTTWYGKDVYEEDVKLIDCSENDSDSLFESQGITYGSKVIEQYKNKYWYRYGNGVKTDRTYLKIGCVATYRIRTDNLSSSKVKDCNNYTTAIKNVNNYYSAAKGYAVAAGGGVALDVVAGIVIAMIGLPMTVIVEAIIAIAGGDGLLWLKCAENVIKYHRQYSDVVDYYEKIKGYGTKL